MTDKLLLTITTPAKVLVDQCPVHRVRAMDDSGCFGILPRHADLISVLTDSVVHWQDTSNRTHYCAIRSGVLIVADGNNISIACREGLTGDNLAELENRVRQHRSTEHDLSQEETTRQMRLHTQTMRQIISYLRPNSGSTVLAGSQLDNFLSEQS